VATYSRVMGVICYIFTNSSSLTLCFKPDLLSCFHWPLEEEGKGEHTELAFESFAFSGFRVSVIGSTKATHTSPVI